MSKIHVPKHIRILWYEDDEADAWVAYSLDGNVAEQGDTFLEATENLVTSMLAYLRHAVETATENEFWDREAPEHIRKRYDEDSFAVDVKDKLLTYISADGDSKDLSARFRKALGTAKVHLADAA